MKKILFNEPYITGKEIEYITDVFSQNKFYGTGKYTDLCTEFIKERLKVDNVLLTDSCTSALEISALLLRNNDEEQEIILPSYTFTSTASAFARAGFKLIFAEVDPDTLMLDISDVKNKISDKTCAIVVVHYGGHCAEIYRYRKLCDEFGIKLIEDAAQAFDCYINDQAIGSIGDFGCFSFHETKNIHAGLSGALLVNDASYIDRATYIWERGTNRQDVLKGVVDKYSWVEVGGSFYPTELQSAFLNAQLEGVSNNIEERKEIYDEYNRGLTPLKNDGCISFPEFAKGFLSNYHAFYVIFESEEVCDRVRERLVASNINAYIGYVPLHSSPVGIKMGNLPDDLPITENIAKRVLRLPFHNNLSDSNVKYICEKIRGFFYES